MNRIALALTTAALSLTTAFSAAQAYDQPSYVRVRSLSYAGSGCPAGSVATNVSPDRQAVTFLWDSFAATIGDGAPFSDKRKNCQVNVDLDFPSGWSYSLATIDARGYVSLERGVTAEALTTFYFQGSATTGRFQTTFRGPEDRDYELRDTLGTGGEVWSPCGAQRSLNVNFEVRLNADDDDARGLITLGDGEDGTSLGFKWRRC
jgi:hypothetical protein